MKILVIGGTVFLGHHFVEIALEQGHEVTLFHRGQHGADLFPEARHVFGDRDGGLDALATPQSAVASRPAEGAQAPSRISADMPTRGAPCWDAVVDCCGYFPRVVRASAEYLKDRTDRYLFVSTISTYASPAPSHQTEDAPLGKIEDEGFEEITGESYGPLKALCEAAVSAIYGDRALIIRPGLIAGPYDPSNRFTYWADRAARGGAYIANARTSQPLQVIDVRDLAAFMLLALEKELAGIYNATGPSEETTFGDLIGALDQEWPDAFPQLIPEGWLKEHGVELWQHLPLTIPEEDHADGLMRVSIRKALNAGLAFRSWAETARDTHAWSQTVPDHPKRHGLDAQREAEVLAEYNDWLAGRHSVGH